MGTSFLGKLPGKFLGNGSGLRPRTPRANAAHPSRWGLGTPAGRPDRRQVLAAFTLGGLSWIGAAHASQRPVRIVMLGDSLTAGFGLPPGQAVPDRLQAALRARGIAVEIENAGVSGDTASGGLERLDWAVDEGVEAVIVELGGNDALRGIDPAVTRKALDEMVGRLTARGLPVLVAGLRAPRNLGAEYTKAFEAIFPEIAKKHGAALYPNFLDGVAGDRRLNLIDGIHPNEAGVAVIVQRIAPAVEALAAEARRRR